MVVVCYDEYFLDYFEVTAKKNNIWVHETVQRDLMVKNISNSIINKNNNSKNNKLKLTLDATFLALSLRMQI